MYGIRVVLNGSMAKVQTPIEIETLLTLNTRDVVVIDSQYPPLVEAIERFIQEGVAERVDCVCYTLTEKGRAWVRRILEVEPPHTVVGWEAFGCGAWKRAALFWHRGGVYDR